MHVYKTGQRLIFADETEMTGKTPTPGEIVTITEVIEHPEASGPAYILKGFERDFDGVKQAFLHDALKPYFEVIKPEKTQVHEN